MTPPAPTRRATRHHPAGRWEAAQAVATLTLPIADRHRRRIVFTDDGGESLMLDLPEAVLLAEGDGLELDGGGIVRVKAAAEAVADVSSYSEEHLARLAWHIGNRHLPLQVLSGGRLRILDDHVIVAMLEGLGARVERLHAPFQPEGGAYSGGGHHGHSHSHSHD